MNLKSIYCVLAGHKIKIHYDIFADEVVLKPKLDFGDDKTLLECSRCHKKLTARDYFGNRQ